MEVKIFNVVTSFYLFLGAKQNAFFMYQVYTYNNENNVYLVNLHHGTPANLLVIFLLIKDIIVTLTPVIHYSRLNRLSFRHVV